MPTNHIEQLRAKLQRLRQTPACRPTGEVESSTSPSGRFSLTTRVYAVADSNQELSHVEVFRVGEAARLAEFWTNEGHLFFGWAEAHGAEYLLGAEDLLGGQTVLDLATGQLAGYSPCDDDGFIWTEFYLSPDGRTLAVLGCYWACPYGIKLYDFSAPLRLPLPELEEIELLDHDETIVGWLDNSTLQTKGIARMRDWLPNGRGGYELAVVSETAVERQLRVDGR